LVQAQEELLVKRINAFNKCIVDQLWFLFHHEMAHFYLRGERAVEDSEERADCYGLMNALASRPGVSLGVFTTVIAGELLSEGGGRLNIGPERAARMAQRYKRMQNVLLPKNLTATFCDGSARE